MASTPDTVKPGDLITAQQWNAMLAKMIELQQRIETLETYNLRIAIEDVLINSPLQAGDAISVLGRNFRTPSGDARAYVDSIEVFPVPGTFTTSRMDLTIPMEVNPPPQGKTVQLRVSRGTTQDTRRLTVQPRVVPVTGDIAIQWTAVEPNTIKPGSTVIWSYTALSHASQTATFSIIPNVNPAGLLPIDKYELLDAERKPLVARQLTLDPRAASPTPFFLRLTDFPNVPDKTNFSQYVNLLLNGVVYASSEPEQFQVNSPVEQPDASISLTIAGVIPDQAWIRPNSINTKGIDGSIEIHLDAEFQAAGTYNLTLSQVGGFGIDQSGLPVAYIVTADELKPSGRVKRDMALAVTRPLTSTADQTLTITLQRQGITQKQSISLVLQS